MLLSVDPLYEVESDEPCTPAPTTSPTPEIFFYPDFTSNQRCSDNQDDYVDIGSAYRHKSKRKCCEAHFWWRVDQCMGDDQGMYYSDWKKCNVKMGPDDGEWGSSDLYDTLEECCAANFWWDTTSCLNSSPNDAKFSFTFDLSSLKAPSTCKEANEMAEGWEYVLDQILPKNSYSNVTTLGCASTNTGTAECGGCFAGLGYIDSSDALFNQDPMSVEIDVRIFSDTCKDATCFKAMIDNTIQTVKSFMTSDKFKGALQDWSKNKRAPTEEMWLADIVPGSWRLLGSVNPFSGGPSSSSGLKVIMTGKCEVQNVVWSSNTVTANEVTSNIETTITSAFDVSQGITIEFTKLCGQSLENIAEPVQCSEVPATFEFATTLYLPYNAETEQIQAETEEILNTIASYEVGAYHIASCSLSDPIVVSIAKFYPDWITTMSCINDGKHDQHYFLFFCCEVTLLNSP